MKLRKKLQTVRARRKEQEEKNKGKLQSEINEVLRACVERINLLQREDLDFYERRKLAIEFKEFVDKYVNPEYRENFYQFINHILHKYRMEAQYKAELPGKVDQEDELASNHVEWPLNCTHIKIAYNIWNNKKSQFRNPLEIAQRLKEYYYEETTHQDNEQEQGSTPNVSNYQNIAESHTNNAYEPKEHNYINDLENFHKNKDNKDFYQQGFDVSMQKLDLSDKEGNKRTMDGDPAFKTAF